MNRRQIQTALARAARRLQRLGYTDVQRYGSGGLSALHGRLRWHFYSVAVVEREAAKARSAGSRAWRR